MKTISALAATICTALLSTHSYAIQNVNIILYATGVSNSYFQGIVQDANNPKQYPPSKNMYIKLADVSASGAATQKKNCGPSSNQCWDTCLISGGGYSGGAIPFINAPQGKAISTVIPQNTNKAIAAAKAVHAAIKTCLTSPYFSSAPYIWLDYEDSQSDAAVSSYARTYYQTLSTQANKPIKLYVNSAALSNVYKNFQNSSTFFSISYGAYSLDSVNNGQLKTLANGQIPFTIALNATIAAPTFKKIINQIQSSGVLKSPGFKGIEIYKLGDGVTSLNPNVLNDLNQLITGKSLQKQTPNKQTNPSSQQTTT